LSFWEDFRGDRLAANSWHSAADIVLETVIKALMNLIKNKVVALYVHVRIEVSATSSRNLKP
jgi:hypothetical protein